MRRDTPAKAAGSGKGFYLARSGRLSPRGTARFGKTAVACAKVLPVRRPRSPGVQIRGVKGGHIPPEFSLPVPYAPYRRSSQPRSGTASTEGGGPPPLPAGRGRWERGSRG